MDICCGTGYEIGWYRGIGSFLGSEECCLAPTVLFIWGSGVVYVCLGMKRMNL